MPRPGGDAWLSIDFTSGDIEYERTDRGWIAYLNDLHKGRNMGSVWSWFLDIFAVACLIFSLTGLVLLKMHAGNRAATWSMVRSGLGADRRAGADFQIKEFTWNTWRHYA